jgi:hypothetical protein
MGRQANAEVIRQAGRQRLRLCLCRGDRGQSQEYAARQWQEASMHRRTIAPRSSRIKVEPFGSDCWVHYLMITPLG